jgi:hypothetical protein
MYKLLLVLALALSGAQQVPDGQTNKIKNGPQDTRDWVNAYFPPHVMEALWHEDYEDLDWSYQTGWLIDIPKPEDPLADALGIRLQTDGDFPIAEAEKDPNLKVKLFRLAKPAAGLLFSIADHVREEEEKQRELARLAPRKSLPISITSLVRTAKYQERLIPGNSNADTKSQGVPATHITGLAADITRANMSANRDLIINRYLMRLSELGLIIYFKEGKTQATYHVIALLQAREFFEAQYDRLLMKARQALAAEPEER